MLYVVDGGVVRPDEGKADAEYKLAQERQRSKGTTSNTNATRVDMARRRLFTQTTTGTHRIGGARTEMKCAISEEGA